MSKQARVITHDDELQTKLRSGLGQLYLVAKACYGPAAGIALIEAPYGDPLASRDGVSNLQKVHLEDPVENKAARIVVQASKKNNVHVGDGTTAVAILAYHLYLAASKMVAGGYNPMEVSRLLTEMGTAVIETLEDLTEDATPELLQHVAAIAAGDEAMGTLISGIAKLIGADGGVIIEDFAGNGIYTEQVEGFFFQKGFTNVNLVNDPSSLESRYANVPILITDKRLATTSDVAPILDKIVEAGMHDLVIVGDVLDEALGALMLMRLKGEITTTVVDAPAVLGGRSLFLDDLALVTGAKVLAPGAAGTDFDINMLGAAEQVVVGPNSTTIVGREGSDEDIAGRVASLREQLAVANHPTDRDAISQRIARLEGKLALIRVGGATEVEQKEVKLRVQDAICAVQAASRGGVLPGGGKALVQASRVGGGFEDVLQAPFRDLVTNAGGNADAYLAGFSPAKPWDGVDLRTMELVDLKKAGVIDASLVVRETVKNAVSVVKILITASVDISYLDRESRHE